MQSYLCQANPIHSYHNVDYTVLARVRCLGFGAAAAAGCGGGLHGHRAAPERRHREAQPGLLPPADAETRPLRPARPVERRGVRHRQRPPPPDVQANHRRPRREEAPEAPGARLLPRRRLLHRQLRVAQLPRGRVRLAGELPALVLSADYRLAPEHRLPAAHRDAETVLSWLRDQAAAGTDAWLAECADFGRVFVCGDSAGGNMVHHVAARLGSGALARGARVGVGGCVILWPYFGGEESTAAEAEAEAMAPSSEFDPGKNFDQMWRLALPDGATRDHPAANPFGPESAPLDDVRFPPVLVAKAGRDRMRDRVAEYVARLRAMGKPVELAEFEGQGHGFFVFAPFGDASDELVRVVRQFMCTCTATSHG